MPSILIVDDDPEVIKFFSYLLDGKPYELLYAQSGAAAYEILHKNKVAVALLDLKLPDSNGIEILKKIKEEQSDCQVIIMTGYSTTKSAVEAIRLGAFDYIEKPFEKIEQLEALIQQAITCGKGSLTDKRDWMEACNELGIVVGENKKMLDTFSLAAKIAKKDLTVLITGETGTGKDLMARFIHLCSKRKENSFFAINCGAVAESLLESELFGHEKGAFTGASQQRKGIFQLADQGTLFLDEIGESSPGIQVKLLRALESGEYMLVGGEKKQYSNVRVVAATNVDLEEAVKNNDFRRDLFFRLDVVRINLLPLRERKEDIPLLVETLLEKKSHQLEYKPTMALKTMMLLKEYHWPGNIRELVNVMDQALALADGNVILPKHLPEKLRREKIKVRSSGTTSFQEIVQSLDHMSHDQLVAVHREIEGLKREIEKKLPHLKSLAPEVSLMEMEQQLISDTLHRCQGNISLAAKMLGVGRNTLYRKIEKLNVDLDHWR